MKKSIIYFGLIALIPIGCKSALENKAQKMSQIWEQKKQQYFTNHNFEAAKINGVCLGETITGTKKYDNNGTIHKIFFSDLQMHSKIPIEFRAEKISDAELIGCIEDTMIQDSRTYDLDQYSNQRVYNTSYKVYRNQYTKKVSIYKGSDNKPIASKIFFGELAEYPQSTSQDRWLNGGSVKESEILDWLFPVLSKNPVIKTLTVFSLPGDTVVGSGEVIYSGTSNITERGICWSTSAGPTIKNNISNIRKAEQIFVCKLTGLKENTTYYARAYIKNLKNVFYGNEIQFTSAFKFIDKRDNHTYHYATIGTQTIMTENFAFQSEEELDHITQDLTPEMKTKETKHINKYCYDWESANKIAPAGWHLPTMEEWEALCDFLGEDQIHTYFGTSINETESIIYYDSKNCFWSASVNNNCKPYLYNLRYNATIDQRMITTDTDKLNNARLFRD